MASAIQSNLAVISMETKGINFIIIICFSIKCHTDHNTYTMKRLGRNTSKTIFLPAKTVHIVRTTDSGAHVDIM